MKHSLIASLAAASAVFLAGCAAEPAHEQPQAAAASATNPCLGVAPSTGSMVRRKEDCGARQTSNVSPEDLEQFRKPAMVNPPSMGPGAGR